MNLSFKAQFKAPILSGDKIHSIREDPHNRWKPGRKIHFATGVRTSYYNCFKEGECVSVQRINIRGRLVYIDYEELVYPKLEMLAINDGFPDLEAFFKWFDQDFDGKIIQWTDFRY